MPFPRTVPDAKLQPTKAMEATLVGKLVNVGDRLRTLNASFGARDYRVFLIKLKWSGSARGTGTVTVLSEVEILPAPRVTDMRTQEYRSSGTVDQGDLEVSEISLTYTEDQLTGRGTGGAPIDPNVDYFWELRSFDGDLDRRMRCVLVGPPIRQQAQLQWRVRLSIQRPGRGRHGDLP